MCAYVCDVSACVRDNSDSREVRRVGGGEGGWWCLDMVWRRVGWRVGCELAREGSCCSSRCRFVVVVKWRAGSSRSEAHASNTERCKE